MNNKVASVFYIKNNIFFVLFILLTGLFSNKAQAKETIIWQSNYDHVTIVPIDDSSNNNDHPVKLSSQKIFDILRSIRLAEIKNSLVNIDLFDVFSSDEENDIDAKVDEEGDLAPPYNALFNKSELQKISSPIAEALLKAKQNEDVIFSVSGRHESLFGKSELSTTARLFYKNKQLNIIFGEVYVNIKKKYRKSGGTSDVPAQVNYKNLKHFRLKTGLRGDKGELPVKFITDNSHILGSYNGKRRKDWLKVDLPILFTELIKSKNIEQRKENIIEETNQLQQQTEKIDQEQEQLKEKVERLERVMQTQEKVEKQAPVKTMPIKTNKSLEERLFELKQLHDKGIVSDEIYNEKVRKLLEEI